MFADSNLFLERDDVKAALMKCRQHDFVRPFREVCDLGEDETRALINTQTPWGGDAADHPRAGAGVADSCFIFSREGLRRVGEWKESSEGSEAAVLLRAERLPRVFQSPARAWQLSRPRALVET
jgi:hypothetical protein